MFGGLAFLCLGSLLCFVNSKPVINNEVLPHSRDYYAGYIKAITDNFDQLFASERQTRSTDEDDEVEAPKPVSKVEKIEGAELVVKKDTKAELKKPESKTPEEKEAKKAEVITNEEDEKDDKSEKAKKKSSNEPMPVASAQLVAPAVTADKVSAQETDVADVSADQHETQISDTEPENAEGDEESDNEDASEEDENEPSAETQSATPADEQEEEDARRNFILEHGDMKNSPFFPNLLSGFQQSQEGAPYNGEIGGDDSSNVGPMPFPGGQLPPFAFPYGQPMAANFFPQNRDDSYTGETRSPQSTAAKDEAGRCADPHHLHRVLVLPQCNDHCHDCCHHPCDTHSHDCGHHGCGCECGHHGGHQELIHDIHHRPIGCPEHYSHESPCLTYPHLNHVGFGYPNGGCGCGCGQPYHSHHPVVLHPTYQETHHHNIHTVGADCGNHGCVTDCGHHNDCGHQGCGCGHQSCGCGCGCGCANTVDHVHVNHVHHVHDQGHHGHHGYHHGADADLHILPHYGHTCAGNSGWNPYWGH